MNGGFCRTTVRSASASAWVCGTVFIRRSEVIEPSGSIWMTRVLRWETDRIWSWFTG